MILEDSARLRSPSMNMLGLLRVRVRTGWRNEGYREVKDDRRSRDFSLDWLQRRRSRDELIVGGNEREWLIEERTLASYEQLCSKT